MPAFASNLRILISTILFEKNLAGEGAAVFIRDSRTMAGNSINFTANHDIVSQAASAMDTIIHDRKGGRLFECHSCVLSENKANISGQCLY